MTETAAENRTVVVERDFAAPPEKLWRALTTPHLIAEWLMRNDFAPAVGHEFQFRATPMPGWNGVIDGKVLVVEPNRRLSYSWVSGEGALALDSVVVFSLTPVAGGTRLTMEQSGFKPGQTQNFQGAKYGWQAFLGKLGQVLETLA
jgi:uncharacterized protein YndB with AHSA1/START domain